MPIPTSAVTFIEVGVVGRPHGVRGELKVFLYNEASRLLEELDSLAIEAGGARRDYEIRGARAGVKYTILTLAGIDSREQADELKGGKLFVERERLPAPAHDEYYVHDLIGMEAFDNGALLGLVTGSRPQGDVEIVTVRGEVDELEVPLVPIFLVEIDFSSRRLDLRDTAELPRNPLRSPRKSTPASTN